MTPAGRAGFTLAELMVALVLFSFFGIVVSLSTSALNRMKTADTMQTRLLNQARLAMEKIVWGPGVDGERDGIAEAVSYTINIAGNTFHYTLPDGVERRIVRSQDELTFHKGGVQVPIHDPNGAGNPPEPANYFTELEFTVEAATVLRIDLVLGSQKGGRWYYASLSTQVALRN